MRQRCIDSLGALLVDVDAALATHAAVLPTRDGADQEHAASTTSHGGLASATY